MKSPVLLLAAGFGTGLLPGAPGTWGTILALLLYLPLLLFSWWVQVTFVLVSVVAGLLICDLAARQQGIEDPGWVVWDEMAAMWLLLLVVPLHWAWWLAAAVLFRLFDILKPWPTSWLDRNLKGGMGIMLDDLAAAGQSWILLVLSQEVLTRWIG